MTNDSVIKRRSTAQVRRLLEIVEASRLSLIKSRRYAETSAAKNSGKIVNTLRDIELSNFAFAAGLRWVLGLGLSAEDLSRIPKEIEDEI